ncbi:MAG: hypothetical protein IKM53_00575 [Clostridia bacterium]|nr:hypothetical protein [Clostridia bacterium]
MNLDKNSVNKIKSMSDSELKRLINEISLSIGADRKKTASLTGDMSKLRNSLNSLSPSDIERFISFIGKDKAEEIIKKINGR